MKKYIIGIDQSTQGTKALLFDGQGALIAREDLSHRQLINEKGWVSHDAMEIYENTVAVVRQLVEKAGIDKNAVAGVGISNQRETSVAWSRSTGQPLQEAIVWQCARAKEICDEVAALGVAEQVREKTGIFLSPYFPASKFAWLLRQQRRNCEFQAAEALPGGKRIGREAMGENINETADADAGDTCLGTVDSWLVYKLTGGARFQTDYSNASRTQLFNLHTLSWDAEICEWFKIPMECLPRVTDSDGDFGETDFEGFFDTPIPIRGVMGDSHGALFGQGCHKPGMVKSTYGTGSSIMMNVGAKPVMSTHGIVTSLAWSIGGKAEYVLEGNINYTGAVITWLQKDLRLIETAKETEELALSAKVGDKTYIVPAFSGLGAPYWDSDATASISGITRTTGKAEVVRAALDSIAYQITDVLKAMEQDAGVLIEALRVDGGPTVNRYLMQFQSDIADVSVQVPDAEELSGIGVAYLAGITLGVFDREEIFGRMSRRTYQPVMEETVRQEKLAGWKKAVAGVLTNTEM